MRVLILQYLRMRPKSCIYVKYVTYSLNSCSMRKRYFLYFVAEKFNDDWNFELRTKCTYEQESRA